MVALVTSKVLLMGFKTPGGVLLATRFVGASTMARMHFAHSGLILQTNEAAAKWGKPTTLEELTSVFLRHLHSELSDTPFSDGPLNEESQVILPHLEKLTMRGWWTVGSQPAVNGARSTDHVFGWGPRGGYVYQKAFVEFFAPEIDVERIISKAGSQGKGWIDYFAVNLEVRWFFIQVSWRLEGSSQGDLRTSTNDDARNAVTWGVFPGQEIVQTTIIERESFLAWKVCMPSYYRCGESLHPSRMRHFHYGPTGRRFMHPNHQSANCSKAFGKKGGWLASSTTIISTPTRFGILCLIYSREEGEHRKQCMLLHVYSVHLKGTRRGYDS